MPGQAGPLFEIYPQNGRPLAHVFTPLLCGQRVTQIRRATYPSIDAFDRLVKEAGAAKQPPPGSETALTP